jgi:hypothetical protein
MKLIQSVCNSALDTDLGSIGPERIRIRRQEGQMVPGLNPDPKNSLKWMYLLMKNPNSPATF